ncbi:hypothetical protein HDU76_003306 [Blyttiomyces sp. JEL0837]|nr:hypothetical protein HDU76_003306 [Blyttiomyces sp. JEL0837]
MADVNKQQGLLQPLIPMIRKTKLVLIILTLIAIASGIVAVTQPYYRIVTNSYVIRLGFTQRIFEDGLTVTDSVCVIDASNPACFISFITVNVGTVIGFATLLFLIVQTIRPSFKQQPEKVILIGTIILTFLSAIVSYTSIGNNWIDPNTLAYSTSWSPDVGFAFCLFAGILYTVNVGIEFFLLWKVTIVETKNVNGYMPAPVYVVVANQGSSYPPSGAYQFSAPQPQQQAYPSYVVPPTQNVVAAMPELKTPTPSPPSNENTAIGSGSYELENMFGVSYHWNSQQVSEWIESKGYEFGVVSRFKKLSIDGRKLHTLTFQSLESELLIDDATVQAKLIKDIQGLRPSSSTVVSY